MPRLKNVQRFSLSVNNDPWLPIGVGMVRKPGETKDVLSTEFNRSPGLKTFVLKGYLAVVGQNQPGDDGPAPVGNTAASFSVTAMGDDEDIAPVEPDQEEEPESEPLVSPVQVPPESRWSRFLRFLHLKS